MSRQRAAQLGLTSTQAIIAVETVTPNETAMSLMKKYYGCVLVFDHGYLSTDAGVILSTEMPEIRLRDKMVVTSPRVKAAKRAGLVSRMIRDIKYINRERMQEDNTTPLPLLIVGEPTVLWGAIQESGVDNIDAVLSLHEEEDYGDALWSQVRPSEEEWPNILYFDDAQMLTERPFIDRLKMMIWDAPVSVAELQEMEEEA